MPNYASVEVFLMGQPTSQIKLLNANGQRPTQQSLSPKPQMEAHSIFSFFLCVSYYIFLLVKG